MSCASWTTVEHKTPESKKSVQSKRAIEGRSYSQSISGACGVSISLLMPLIIPRFTEAGRKLYEWFIQYAMLFSRR
jgi:hypothetical protein